MPLRDVDAGLSDEMKRVLDDADCSTRLLSGTHDLLSTVYSLLLPIIQ